MESDGDAELRGVSFRFKLFEYGTIVVSSGQRDKQYAILECLITRYMKYG